jgi:nitroreductase
VNIDFQVEEAVKKRYSVRNYKEEEVETGKRKGIESFVDRLDNPFDKKVSVHYLNKNEILHQQTLGTYGVIKGAMQYIGATIKAEPMTLEALGYELEAVVLYLSSLGIGTCWLGGTFNRKGFAKAMDIAQDDLFPVIMPYGYAAERKHVTESIMRAMIQADHRKKWAQLFYKNDFQSPLTKEDAGSLAFALEMVRLGPSASNKQPWRILLSDNACHFYEYKEPKYSDSFPYDIQRIDMGIAAAHFDFSVKEMGVQGHFDITCEPEIELPSNMEYVYSWIRE